MTFLNPLVLFGLAAAAIPVILHLLNLRKLRTIEFSTLSFLKELQQTKIRKLKFRQILLLILRTLAVLCIVMAFARPALHGSLFGKLGGSAHSTVVFIFDDSFSMSASDQFGELLKQAKDKTERLLDLLNDGDEVYLIKLSDLPGATIDPATHDIPAVRRAIRETHVSMIRRPMTEALALAKTLLSRSNNANKEVYVVSDMQKTLFPTGGQSTAARDSAGTPSGNYFLVEIGSKEIDNVSIDSVDVVSKIFEAGKPVQISVIVRNFSSTPVANSALSAFLENARAGQSTLHIDPWGTATVSMNLLPKKTGIIRGFVELENDAIEQDNRRYFSFVVPQQISVAIVSDNASDARFPMLALRATASDSGASPLKIQQVSSTQFPLVDLKTTDVLILMNTKGISATGNSNIANYVNRGGGLIILPAGSVQPAELNSLLQALAIPPVTGISGSAAVPANLSFQTTDLDHPLFGTIFEQAGKKRENSHEIESPQINIALQSTTGKTGHTIIAMTGGQPFLSEYLSGQGKVLLYEVAPVLAWSDFPLKGIFVPLMHRSVVYLASPPGGTRQTLTGDDALIVVRPPATDNTNGAQYSLIAPDGTSEYILPLNAVSEDVKEQPAAQKAAISIPSGLLGFLKPRIPVSGYYELKRGSDILAVLSTNVDTRESDTRKMEQSAFAEEWSKRGIKPEIIGSAEQASALQTVVTQSRFGVELWRYFLIAALLLALTEMWVARDGSQKE